jgi:hypothetical protein
MKAINYNKHSSFFRFKKSYFMKIIKFLDLRKGEPKIKVEYEDGKVEWITKDEYKKSPKDVGKMMEEIKKSL